MRPGGLGRPIREQSQPFMSNRNLALDCSAGELLHPVDAAFDEIVAFASLAEGRQTIPVRSAAGRVLASDVSTGIPLPPFDHSAVDGFGITQSDLNRPPPLHLTVTARVAAGGRIGPAPEAGHAVRLFTGAPIPQSVVAVALEERCELNGRSLTVTVPVPEGANIRRGGEDVPKGSIIVEAGNVLDARHIAILVAAGVSSVEVRRAVRVAVLSNGNELREPGAALEAGQIHDANRPMLTAMLANPWTDVIDLGCHADDARVLGQVFSDAATRADVVVSSGGVAGSDADHIARAVASAGGSMRRFRLALKPGKPILAGRIGRTAVLGLPGNPVAAMVNFLLFGRALISASAGARVRRPLGQPAIAATPFGHAAGRTEFVPTQIAGSDERGRPRLEKLGRGGSARLRPLVLADGLAEIPADAGELPAGAPIAFHAFRAAFAP
jgi:molybdopterin molybdotransferase